MAKGGMGRKPEREMLVFFKLSLCLGLRFFVLLPGWLTKALLKSTQSAYSYSCSCSIVKIAYG